MGRHKILTSGRISAKKKWRELHKAHPREMHGRQAKEYRRKTGQTKDLYIPKDIPKSKYKIANSWTTDYNSGPVVPDAPLDIPWHAKIAVEDGRKKEVKQKKRLQKLTKHLPDMLILPELKWWFNLPETMSIH